MEAASFGFLKGNACSLIQATEFLSFPTQNLAGVCLDVFIPKAPWSSENRNLVLSRSFRSIIKGVNLRKQEPRAEGLKVRPCSLARTMAGVCVAFSPGQPGLEPQTPLRGGLGLAPKSVPTYQTRLHPTASYAQSGLLAWTAPSQFLRAPQKWRQGPVVRSVAPGPDRLGSNPSPPFPRCNFGQTA